MTDFPDWVEPMAATLTRSGSRDPSGSSSASSMASVSSRSAMARRFVCFRGTACPRRCRKLPVRLPACLCETSSSTVKSPGATGRSHITSSISCGSMAATSGQLPLEARRGPAGGPAVAGAPPARGVARRLESVGPGLRRRMGRRHRKAPRLRLRAPPLTALAQDEVRARPGARRRRIH